MDSLGKLKLSNGFCKTCLLKDLDLYELPNITKTSSIIEQAGRNAVLQIHVGSRTVSECMHMCVVLYMHRCVCECFCAFWMRKKANH